MANQDEKIVLRELDEEKFIDNITDSLWEDNIAESCYTNFKDGLIITIGQTISEIFEKDGWELKTFGELTMFNEKDTEKIFNAFIENSEFTVTIRKKGQKNEFKEVVVKLDFPEAKKKEIAELYVDTILIGYYYLDICIFLDLDEINVDTLSEVLSDEVYQLLSPEEIKTKFKDKIEETINHILSYDSDNE